MLLKQARYRKEFHIFYIRCCTFKKSIFTTKKPKSVCIFIQTMEEPSSVLPLYLFLTAADSPLFSSAWRLNAVANVARHCLCMISPILKAKSENVNGVDLNPCILQRRGRSLGGDTMCIPIYMTSTSDGTKGRFWNATWG